MGGVVLIKGNVSGTEFAPTHFQTREFSFYEIPFLHLQITPIWRKDITGPVARQVRAKSWITVPRGKKPNDWHLISLNRGPTSTPAVAELLSSELTLSHGGTPFWKGWNDSNPKRASVLWPLVQRLADRELYVLIPELMQLARTLPGGDNAQTLTGAVQPWLIDQYVSLVTDLRDAKRDALAEEILAEAIADFPNTQSLEELRRADG